MNVATESHVRNNPHHPEYWSDRKDNLIPKGDRDKFDPNSVPTIDVNSMNTLALFEMIADWCAMSKEKGTNTPKEWADRVLGKRWRFPESQTDLIYLIISLIWGKND